MTRGGMGSISPQSAVQAALCGHTCMCRSQRCLPVSLPQDNGTEHPHRVCISARADVTPAVVSELQQEVAASGLQVSGPPAAAQLLGALRCLLRAAFLPAS